ncbi:alkaline phosphatase family protein [Phytomonospora sp. NPDC050363]|uniref:alkaline phosphatase family protein n=1 Tax=Phytomonospora sp. NPDC050363 TaxID=3155642 RepID=UPI0033F7979F
MNARVLVFGLDGIRFDRLRSAKTPHLDAIAAAGFLAPTRIRDVNPTISGPCWATIATGVHADEHGILGNDLSGHRLASHPCFLARATAAGLTSYAVAAWPPLLTGDSGGPIFRPELSFVPDPRPGEPAGGDPFTDQAAADHACEVLAGTDVDVAFVYFGAVDEVGHHVGTGPEYDAQIEETDARVGQVLAAIEGRAHYAEETWTVLAVTDHGHVDGGGHGGDSDLERTAWIAGRGPGLRGNGVYEHADIPVLVLSALGVARPG